LIEGVSDGDLAEGMMAMVTKNFWRRFGVLVKDIQSLMVSRWVKNERGKK
jgi:hypothetical protein